MGAARKDFGSTFWIELLVLVATCGNESLLNPTINHYKFKAKSNESFPRIIRGLPCEKQVIVGASRNNHEPGVRGPDLAHSSPAGLCLHRPLMREHIKRFCFKRLSHACGEVFESVASRIQMQ